MRQVLILGGGYAGMLAAGRLAHLADEASITLVDARSEFTQRIRLHEMLVGARPDTAPYRELLEPKGITFHQGRVERLDVAARRVTTVDVSGGKHDLSWDLLVITLGSTTGAPLPGVAEHTVRLNDPEEIAAAAVRIAAIAERGGSVLVAGGGLTGIESASELAGRYPGLKVTLLSRDRIDNGYSAAGVEHIRATLQKLGVRVIERKEILSFDRGVARTRDGDVPFDLAIWAGGFVPPAIGREAALPVDAAGGIVVDERLQVIGHPEIFVAGDAASCNASWGHLRMGCVTASPMGAHAGENARRLLAGEDLRPFDFAFPGRNLSLGRHEGLIQMTDYSDTATERIFTGRVATLVKELIGKGTFKVPQWELTHGLKVMEIFGRKVPVDRKRFKTEGEIEWKATA